MRTKGPALGHRDEGMLWTYDQHWQPRKMTRGERREFVKSLFAIASMIVLGIAVAMICLALGGTTP